MKGFRIVMMLFVVLIGCGPLSLFPGATLQPTQKPESTPIPTPRLSDGTFMLTDPQDVVDKMRALCCEDGWWDHLSAAENKFDEVKNNGEEFDIGAAFLENLEAAGERFDVNSYFTVLTHLAPEDGYVLDYVYFGPGGDGAPYLYARRGDEPPVANYSEYQKAGIEDYSTHILVDGTAEGYFELAVLSIMAGQFYLAWHFEYNDWEVVSSQERLGEIIEALDEKYTPLTAEQEDAALQLDLVPSVMFAGDKVKVRVLMFTKWGGFYERVYTIDRHFPHRMVDEDTQLIPYNCGIMF